MDGHLTFVSLLLVIVSGFMNALWNFGAKKSKHKSVFLGSILVVPSAVLMPYLVYELIATRLPLAAYLLMALSMTAQCVYSYLLSVAYKLGDLSQVHPIMRGTGVLLIPLFSVAFLGESLSAVGWAGVAGIAFGILILTDWSPRGSAGGDGFRQVLFAVLIGCCITVYTLVDKLTLRYVTPLMLLQISNIGFLLVHLPQLFHLEKVREEWRLNWKLIFIGSIVSPGSYFLFLLAMNMSPVSHIAPVREISTVFAALLGVLLLKEKHGIKRMICSLFVAAGIFLIGISGAQ
jgi:uncharacterized membrane protein